MRFAVNAPALLEFLDGLRSMIIPKTDEKRHVVTNAASADDDDPLSGPDRPIENAGVAHDARIISAGDV